MDITIAKNRFILFIQFKSYKPYNPYKKSLLLSCLFKTFFNIAIIEKWDCKGKLTNAWGLGGEVKFHSIELLFLLNSIWNKSLKYWAINQGYLDTKVPLVNCTYNNDKKYHVPTTLIIDP